MIDNSNDVLNISFHLKYISLFDNNKKSFFLVILADKAWESKSTIT